MWLVVNVAKERESWEARLVVNVVQDEMVVQPPHEIEGNDLWRPLRMG